MTRLQIALASLAFVGLASLPFACSHGGSTSTDQSGGAAVAPAAVQGYGGCTEPLCTDLARACDDLLRSGCGASMLSSADPVPQPGSADYATAVSVCTNVAFVGLGESLDSVRQLAGAANESEEDEERARASLAAEVARCTRRALSCQERFDCLRGRMLPPKRSADAGVPADAPADTAPPPIWSEPYKGTSPDFALSPPPWSPEAGVGRVSMVPGVDSPSCTRCVVERCPTFAYRCFAAEGDAVDCPNGDCCESLRKCVYKCGGYTATASPYDFYTCLAKCEVGRPSAAQQLADLQGCAAVACAGCQQYDTAATLDPEAGIVRSPSVGVDAGSEVSP